MSGLPRRVSRASGPNLEGIRPYQCEGVGRLRSWRSGILADEMRLGKTAQLLRALPVRASAIVVCPAIAILVWRDEMAKWRPDLIPVLVEDLRQPREGEVLIISWDSLPDRETHRESSGLVPYSLTHCHLILDEVHYAKNPAAQRTQKVRRLGNQCRVVWGATGTPMVGDLDDLYNVLESCRVPWIQFPVVDTFADHLSRVMLRRLRSDVYPDLPRKQYQIIPVPAPEDLRDYLDEITEQWDLLDPDELPPFEMISEARKAIARSRITESLTFAQDLLGEGPLIFSSCHREPILAAQERLGARVILGETPQEERREIVRLFADGSIKLVAMTADSGGTAVDFSAADQVLEHDLHWTPGVNAQLEARAEAVGKDRPVHVYRMVSDHVLDRRVVSVLDRKQREIVEVVR